MYTRSTHYFFFFNDTATTEIYTLSLHDALPICCLTTRSRTSFHGFPQEQSAMSTSNRSSARRRARSEEHTSELQSLAYLVCRLLLEKKKNKLEPGLKRGACDPSQSERIGHRVSH